MKLKKGIFITGTDTEVGKTVVARAVVRALVKRGKKVCALKPVESGAPEIDGKLEPSDAGALAGAACFDGPIDQICRYAFPDPVSPHLAAARVGAVIDSAACIDLLRKNERDHDLVVAEGAGGLMVPLSDNLLYADLVAQSGYQLLIVSPNVLGTINSTLLTIEAARNRKIDILGVVLNKTPTGDLGNARAIEHYGEVKILGEFPTAPIGANDDVLAELAEAHLDLSLFF